MRSRFVLTLCLIAVLPSCGGVKVGNPSKSKAKWKSRTFSEVGLRAEFPNDPKHTTSPDGKEHRYTSELRNGRCVLRVAYQKGFDTTIPVRTRLNAIRSEMKATKFRTQNVTLSGHDGMEAEMDFSSGNKLMTGRIRYFHVGTTSYAIFCISDPSVDVEDEIDRFIHSVELTDRR